MTHPSPVAMAVSSGEHHVRGGLADVIQQPVVVQLILGLPGHQRDRRRGLGDVPAALGPRPGQLDELLAAGDDHEVPRLPVLR